LNMGVLAALTPAHIECRMYDDRAESIPFDDQIDLVAVTIDTFFHILMPYPGTAVYDQMKRENRLLYNGAWWNADNYRYNHASFIPKTMTPDELTHAAISANKRFYSASSIAVRAFDFKTTMRTLQNLYLYLNLNITLRTTSI
jgi:radical SAM superfamily enzyme YgiQ (UPF0313 family)